MAGLKTPPIGTRRAIAIFAVVACASMACGMRDHAASATTARTFTAYVGTYTGAGSEGIYRLEFDPASGTSTPPVLAGTAENPSFLAFHPNGRFLYAVNELATFGDAPTGAVSAFEIDPETHGLQLLDQQVSGGADPCHIVVDRTGRSLLVANYTGGSVAVLPISADGRLRPASMIRRHAGNGPIANRQEGPHAHEILLDPAERFALAVDLGADRIFSYRFEAGSGTLEPGDPAATVFPPGSGPRHLAWHPSGRFVFAVSELASTVTSFRYDPARGVLERLQTITTLPQGSTGTNTAAEIAVSPDGRVLYASNRGDDSLAIYAIDAGTGTLTDSGHVPTGGRTPRHFAIDPSGRWLLVANQDSGTIRVFRLDPVTGWPSPAGQSIIVSKPACIVFRPTGIRPR